jgi:UDP-N-acetylglucosamine acyltransferase
LKRRGIDQLGLDALEEAHRLLFRARTDIDQAIEVLAGHGHLTLEVEILVDSLRARQAGRHSRARARLGQREPER